MSACQEIRLKPDANHLYELFVSYVRHYSVHVLFKTRIFPWINELYKSVMISGVRPISGNPGLKFCFVSVFTLPTYGLELHFELLLLYLQVKAQQYFVNTSYMFIDKKTFGLILV